ncbi:MAG: MBL fold metallo-hydrolase, partial [Bacilli bacterium]
LNMDFMGRQMVIHPTLIWDNDTVILVDTGMPGQLPQIRKAMDEIGVPLSKLGEVILTHQDIDHIGGLSDILKASGRKIEILAHEADRPYIEGAKP